MRNYSRRSKMLRSRWEANASKRKKTKTSSAKLRTRSVINVVSVPMKKTNKCSKVILVRLTRPQLRLPCLVRMQPREIIDISKMITLVFL